jgi:hypothetical protein
MLALLFEDMTKIPTVTYNQHKNSKKFIKNLKKLLKILKK